MSFGILKDGCTNHERKEAALYYTMTCLQAHSLSTRPRIDQGADHNISIKDPQVSDPIFSPWKKTIFDSR